MKYLIVSRILSASILSIVLAMYLHYSAVHSRAAGKDVYLARQAKMYDALYVHPPVVPYGKMFLSMAALLGPYELLAFGIYAVIRPRTAAT
jgi:hypothetical protein